MGFPLDVDRPTAMPDFLSSILRGARGDDSRMSFAKRLGLSYTFVRSLEDGLRLPSDEVLTQIAANLGRSSDELLVAAYCDRSPMLSEALERLGFPLTELFAVETDQVPTAPLPTSGPSSKSAPPAEPKVPGGTKRGD